MQKSNASELSLLHLGMPLSSQLFFNKDIICLGEPLKVVVKGVSNAEITPRLFALDECGEVRGEVWPLKWVSHKPLQWHAQVETGGGRVPPGLYVAELWSPLVQFLDNPAFSELNDEPILAKHFFQVLESKEYFEGMLSLFGGAWDPPIYWDEMTPDKAQELLFGLPVTATQVRPKYNTSSPPDADTRVAKHNFYSLLGDLIKHFMERETGRLPFNLKYEYNGGKQSAPPHFDLTKLLWLLSVLAPSWADIVFFGANNKLSMKVSKSSVSFSLSLDPEQRLAGNIHPPLMPPRLFDVIRVGFRQGAQSDSAGKGEAAERFKFKLDYNLGYETSLSLFTLGGGTGGIGQYGSPGEHGGKGGWDPGGSMFY